MQSFLKSIEVTKSTGALSGIVYFFHGSGDSGKGVSEWVKHLMKNEFNFPHVKIMYPTAPARPYTLLHGQPSTVWFDRHSLSLDAPEHQESVDETCAQLVELIKYDTVTNKVPIHRVVIGGFSMGGALAIHLAYRFLPEVAGVFALSSFLNNDTSVYETIKCTDIEPVPLFMCHGENDSLVPNEWARFTFEQLQHVGVTGVFHNVPNADHELTKPVLQTLKDFIIETLPEEEEYL